MILATVTAADAPAASPSARADVAWTPRRRGASKRANWRRDKDAPTAVIVLEVDCSLPQTRVRVERMFAAAFQLRRATQDTARDRVDAYWAAHRLRDSDAKTTRERFGLSRNALETAAYRHVDASTWLGRHVTKALAMHLADEVWEACDRHLFRDASGKTHGRPRIGRWFDFTRIPGRARSHTKARTWETFRLVGSLAAHAETYRPRGSSSPDSPNSALTQPRVLPAPVKPRGGWWTYDGPLAVVFTGQTAGDLVLPVRLPQGAGQWARIQHFLTDPASWHKIDLVRVQDVAAPGGWRYYAHLMVLKQGWTSPARLVARAAVPTGRLAGVDANVSNLAVASFTLGPRGTAVSKVSPSKASTSRTSASRGWTATNPRIEARGLRTDHVSVTPAQRAAAARAAHQARLRSKAMERSRRVANPEQYEPSPGQAERARRRKAAGQLARAVQLPKGPRVANKAGIPEQAYRRDTLTPAYRRTRAQHTTASRGQARARDASARDVAERIVAAHGANLVIEGLSMSGWARRWGKAMALFTPGRLMTALAAETKACGGGLTRISTWATALSQTCVCGHRAKKSLSERVHRCVQPDCRLVGDRDLVSAVLAACVTLTTPTDPSSARIDPHRADALGRLLAGQQEALARSTTPRPPASPQGSGRVDVAAIPAQRVLNELASAGCIGDTCETPDETPCAGTTRDHAADEHLPVTPPVPSRAALRLNS